MRRKYSDEFKLSIVKEYYESPLGVRMITSKNGLPSKNYITRWEQELKNKGLLPENSTKKIKAAGRSKEKIARADSRTVREKEYESKINQLEARVEYLESLEKLKPFLKKK
jgi:transposase-like protein